jgi:hypothetical protein
VSLFEQCVSPAYWKRSDKPERWRRVLQRSGFGVFPLGSSWSLIVCAVATFAASAVADITCDAPISASDVQQITGVIRGVTDKPIMFIMGVTEDNYVPGAVVTGRAWMEKVDIGERTYLYTRTDIVSVWTEFTDRKHVDIYTVRKTQDRWKIEGKKDGSLP